MFHKTPKKVGLALGGGAAKGLAHIGVIRTLEKAGIDISFISGTSMGALVGGYYAATKDINFIENFFIKMKHSDVYPVTRILRKRDGSIFKNELMELLEGEIRGKKIEDCEIPFAAVATDVETGDEVVLKTGDLREAIKASTALPLIFPPVNIGGRVLMDGGFVNPVPADVVRGMGAEYVIAVDVSSKWFNFEEEKMNPMKIYSVMPKALSMIEYQIARRILPQADIVLTPPVLGYKWFKFADAEEIIKCGASEAKNKLRTIFTGSHRVPPPRTTLDKFLDFIFYQD
ncbi:hypothetical protein A3I34_01500 [Candidatus Jorgensenbacteria bacterium RIFCSPLOWO2_02_FULL_45_12]|uniref:PNPLA domain-containing protein n=2 Tax=Candidatus Joergenseniibacteriota TaxID=1752739 RepID=A0A1F6BQ92_9BACT|nr:MAG: Lysophospholipase [Candidatus Jorgensenbacteria bacterium GW2011_GWA2_45_9]OGG38697.1 MAG: hypothetical protein A3D55_02370 [Candidatus Jorgensenbacteria bacterium RIFCSPHIGHO2_02_FULL_45_20]OGG42344.1 MAG: hypothetical protein A3I34_01500 [Candidatus Jorgensenbacteria bacterium RIFCSPLOWO2_02_FULL_45_12]